MKITHPSGQSTVAMGKTAGTYKMNPSTDNLGLTRKTYLVNQG
jgi:hypothetical protein